MTSKSYIRVFWAHESEAEPFDLWSELDADRFETRKIEFFRDGRIGFADASEAIGGTRLSEAPIPTLDEIVRQPEFKPEPVSRTFFEKRWQARRDSLSLQVLNGEDSSVGRGFMIGATRDGKDGEPTLMIFTVVRAETQEEALAIARHKSPGLRDFFIRRDLSSEMIDWCVASLPQKL